MGLGIRCAVRRRIYCEPNCAGIAAAQCRNADHSSSASSTSSSRSVSQNPHCARPPPRVRCSAGPMARTAMSNPVVEIGALTAHDDLLRQAMPAHQLRPSRVARSAVARSDAADWGSGRVGRLRPAQRRDGDRARGRCAEEQRAYGRVDRVGRCVPVAGASP
jgi:hypothetical protein